MGMFDEITCHYPLKDCPDELLGVNREWQTKDLECDLSHYTLTKEGRLIKRQVKWEWQNDTSSFMGGRMIEVEAREVDTEFHGFVIMYTHTKNTGQWIEYRLKFTDGQLVDAKKGEPT